MTRVLFALALLPLPAAASRPEEPAPIPVVVPFELLATDHMVVRARVNGEGPYRMIFDLGAPVTLLSPRAAEASGYRCHIASTASGDGGCARCCSAS